MMSKLDIQEIRGDDRLLRRVIYVDPNHIRDDGTPTSLAFKLRRGEDALSTDLERLTTYELSILDPRRFRLFALNVNEVWKLNLKCEHDPKPDNPAHSRINGPFSSSIPKKLSKLAVKVPRQVRNE